MSRALILGRERELDQQAQRLSVELGVTPMYPSAQVKPARQGVYRVLFESDGVCHSRWAYFGIADGWHWPKQSLLWALRSFPMNAPRARVLEWQGLAADPNEQPITGA